MEPLARSSPELTHTFRFLAGGIAALEEANRRGYKDRSAYSGADAGRHLQELLDHLTSGGGTTPTDDTIAAFFYNAGIMRLHACYERLLKAVNETLDPSLKTESKASKTDSLSFRIETALSLPPFNRQRLETNRCTVNRLKHELFGQLPQHSDGADIDKALEGIKELLTILEHPAIQGCLKTAYGGAPRP
jgi:hypothetical protein